MQLEDCSDIIRKRRLPCNIHYPDITNAKTTNTTETPQIQESVIAVNILAHRLCERYNGSLDSQLHTDLPETLVPDKPTIILVPTTELIRKLPTTEKCYNKWNDKARKLLLKAKSESLPHVLVINVNLEGDQKNLQSASDIYFSSVINFKNMKWEDIDREIQQITKGMLHLLDRALTWPLQAEKFKDYLKEKESHDGNIEIIISIPAKDRQSLKEALSDDETAFSYIITKRSSEADVQPQLGKVGKRDTRRFGIVVDQSGRTSLIIPSQLAEALPGSQRYSVLTQPLKYPTTDTGGVTVLKDDDEEQVHLRRQIHDPRQTTEHEQHTSQDNKPENKTLIVLSSTHNIDETNRAFRNNCDDKEDIHYLFIPVAHVTQPWTDNFKLQLMERLPSQNTQYRLVILIVYADTIIDNDGRRNIRFEQQDTCLLQQLLHIFTNTNNLVCGDPHHRALILASPLQQTQHFATPLEPVQLGTHSALVAFADSSQGLGGDGLTFINRIVEHLESTHAITSLLDQTNEQVRQNSQGQQVPVYHTNFDGEVQLVHR